MIRIAFQLIVVFFWATSVAITQERFGLLGIADGTVSQSPQPYSVSADSPIQTNLNGQLVLLGTLRLREDLNVFYEGRLNHIEGLAGSEPRLQQTRGNALLQGYLHYSPKLPLDFNLQIGKFGTPFGHFLTRNYSNQNPLIGFPLIYTHRTTIQSSQIPAGSYSQSNLPYEKETIGPYRWGYGSGPGLPLINFPYPTGIMAFGNPGKMDYRVALVNSSLANPLDLGDPGQRAQWIVAGGLTCLPGLRLGSSYTQGPYLDASVNSYLPAGISFTQFEQRALGFDSEFAFRHVEVYAELLFSNYEVPNIPQRLGATGYFIEFKQTWTPRVFTAVRWNQIYFDRIRTASLNGSELRFDNNLNSLEIGLGYRFAERLLAKASYQHQHIDAAEALRNNTFRAQLVYAFDLLSLLRVQ